MPCTLLIADDHWVVRKALRAVVAGRPDLIVVGEAADGFQAVELCDKLNPDLMLLDISLPGLSGMQVLEQLNARTVSPSVIVFTMHPADQYARHVRNLGAKGFLSKDSDAGTILSTLDQIINGGVVFPMPPSPEKTRRKQTPRRTVELLSKREKEVLRGLVQGERNTVIADRLGISSKSVSTYRQRLFEKLNVETNAGLVTFATRSGIILDD
jgi:two-component system invasion response regulator UvrY